MKHYCIVNTENKLITDRLKQYGYICIATEKSANVSSPICRHADVLYLKTDSNSLAVSDCQQNNIVVLKEKGFDIKEIKLAAGYKTESKLNIIITDENIICNSKTCEADILITNKNIINVNQGYTKCSTIVIDCNNFITEDEGIYNALTQAGKNCLLITKGYAELKGYDYGFIGGASAYLSAADTLLFFGNISKHPDYCKIMNFTERCKIKIDYIEDIKLQDIGGIVEL